MASPVRLSAGLAAIDSASLAQRNGMFLFALLLLTAAFLVQNEAAQLGFGVAGTTLVALPIILWLLRWLSTRRAQATYRALTGLIENDLTLGIVTDAQGVILSANKAAIARFSRIDGQTLAGILRSVLAQPDAVIRRLSAKAGNTDQIQEDVATRRGHIRISLRRFAGDKLLWRLEESAERTSASSVAGRHLPMLTLGRQDTILSVNDAARALFGERPKSLDRIFLELPPKNGQTNWISTKDGVYQYFVCVLETAGARREVFFLPSVQADAKTGDPLAAEVHQNQRDFDSLPVALLRLAGDGTVLGTNNRARALLGADDIVGMSLSQLLEGLGRSIVDWLQEALRGGRLNQSEVLRVTRPDREVFVQVSLSRAPESVEPELIAVLNDATELKTLEAQFVQSQKMQAIGQLAGGVAHDFNNLLTAISGHCDLLLLRHDRGDPDFGDLVQIHQNANRAAALVGQLLAFSRKQTLRPEVLDLRDTLSDLTHLLNRLVGEKVTLTLSHEPILSAVRADKRQLEQVVMNLVVNARDAMPDGGEIRIETESLVLEMPLRRDRVVVSPGEYVSIKVIDHGVGIAADKLQKVFEPFYTTKRTGEGTGLGLSTVYGIVKQSGGFVFLDSTEGEGSCFTLLFPAYDARPVDRRKAAGGRVAIPLRPADGVVLLVEDEAPVRAFASRALRLRGYTVLEAESAEDALKMLEDSKLKVDVFVTDVVMPGMDGPSWVRKALEDRPGVRVVFVSGYAEDAFGENQARIPNSVFLPKPFSLVELTEIVQRQLH